MFLRFRFEPRPKIASSDRAPQHLTTGRLYFAKITLQYGEIIFYIVDIFINRR
jgi:hypothetical protein